MVLVPNVVEVVEMVEDVAEGDDFLMFNAKFAQIWSFSLLMLARV